MAANEPFDITIKGTPVSRLALPSMPLRSDYNGYCVNCLSNVEHVRVVKSRFVYWLDKLTWRLPELFGFGPWYCVSCGKRRILFPPYRRGVTQYDPNHIQTNTDAESEWESLGNLHLSSVSLVHRANRARYYSEKFREGIAERILSCAVPFSQVRDSLGISELDLQDWLNRYLQSKIHMSRLAIHHHPDDPASDTPSSVDDSAPLASRQG